MTIRPGRQAVLALALLLVSPLAVPAAQDPGATADATPPAERPSLDTTATEAPQATPVDVPASEDPRYWRVFKALAETLNAEDTPGFEALFQLELLVRRDASGDPIADTVGFMARTMAQRGSIDRFYALAPQGLRMAGSAHLVRLAVFLFEDGTTGYFGVALDERDKIVDFSYFVLPDLCARGGPRCQGEPIPLAALPVGD